MLYAEKKVPFIAFTRENSPFKIASDRHVVAAAFKLEIGHIKAIFVPRSALESKQVEQIFF